MRTYRVCSDVNVLLCAELNKLWLEKAGMALNLVGGGGDTGTVDERLEVLLGVVGNTNCPCLLLVELSHSLPCLDNRDAIIHLHVLVGVAGTLIKREELVVGVLGLIESDGEMNKIKVKVVEAELRKAVIQRTSDVFWAVLRVPELRSDENILTLQVGDLSTESLLERLSNLLLVSVAMFIVISTSSLRMTTSNSSIEYEFRSRMSRMYLHLGQILFAMLDGSRSDSEGGIIRTIWR
jgi:hypothetical protein